MYLLSSFFQRVNFIRITLILGFALTAFTAKAQIPVEVLAGNNQIQHQFFFFKDLDQNRKINLFSMARFSMDYEEKAFNNSLISSQLTYNLTPFLGISGGATFNNDRLSPLAAVSFTYMNQKQDLFFTLFPSVVFGEELNYEVSGIFLYSPKLTKNFNLFTQVIFISNFDKQLDNHLFSNQQYRVGIDYKRLFQVGIGVDQNFINISESHLTPRNIGIFLRKEL